MKEKPKAKIVYFHKCIKCEGFLQPVKEGLKCEKCGRTITTKVKNEEIIEADGSNNKT